MNSILKYATLILSLSVSYGQDATKSRIDDPEFLKLTQDYYNNQDVFPIALVKRVYIENDKIYFESIVSEFPEVATQQFISIYEEEQETRKIMGKYDRNPYVSPLPFLAILANISGKLENSRRKIWNLVLHRSEEQAFPDKKDRIAVRQIITCLQKYDDAFSLVGIFKSCNNDPKSPAFKILDKYVFTSESPTTTSPDIVPARSVAELSSLVQEFGPGIPARMIPYTIACLPYALPTGENTLWYWTYARNHYSAEALYSQFVTPYIMGYLKLTIDGKETDPLIYFSSPEQNEETHNPYLLLCSLLVDATRHPEDYYHRLLQNYVTALADDRISISPDYMNSLLRKVHTTIDIWLDLVKKEKTCELIQIWNKYKFPLKHKGNVIKVPAWLVQQGNLLGIVVVLENASDEDRQEMSKMAQSKGRTDIDDLVRKLKRKREAS